MGSLHLLRWGLGGSPLCAEVVLKSGVVGEHLLFPPGAVRCVSLYHPQGWRNSVACLGNVGCRLTVCRHRGR